MKLSIIGYWGAYPGSGGASSGYLIEETGPEGNESILLDCGSGVLSKLYKYIDLSLLNNVVLSHYHSDHVADIGCLQYASKVQLSLHERSTPISIYGHNLSDFSEKLTYEDASVFRPYNEKTPLQIGLFTLKFKRTPHPAPTFAIRVETEKGSVGYSADTGWDDELIDFFKGVDLLLCESSLYNKFKGKVEGHLTSGEAGKLARYAGAGELILTHLPHFGDHGNLLTEAEMEYSGKVTLAKKGLSWHTQE